MPGIVHVLKRLTDICLRFPPEQRYCGNAFFPTKPVEHLSDQILRWSKGNILRLDELALSAPDDELPPEVELILSADDTYNCRVYAVRSPDKVITKLNADPAMDYNVERALHCKGRLDTRLEYLRINQTLRSTAIMTATSTLTAAQRWDNATSPSNTPVTTGRNIVTQIKSLNGGNPPNVVRFTSEVMNGIVTSEEFKDFSKYGRGGRSDKMIGDNGMVEDAWGLPPGSIDTCDATYNATHVGLTPSYRKFLGGDVVFAYVTPPGLRTYGLGAEFRFSGYNTDPYAILTVPQYQRGAIPGEDIRAIAICDAHVYNAESGYLLRGVVDITNPAYGGFLD